MATLRQTFSDIASAIRAKGVSGTMKPIEMASKIGEIQTGGGIDYGYLTFTAEENSVFSTAQWYPKGATLDLMISYDGSTWQKYSLGRNINVNKGDVFFIKGGENASTRTAISSDSPPGYYRTSKIIINKGKASISGDIRSIIKFVTPGNYEYWFASLFNGCIYLTQAPKLPATTLTDSCYYNMFYGCTSLTQAPKLPATTLTDSCYYNMFYGCTSLTKAPELPATNLYPNCYNSMFYGCTSLTTAPELPATTLDDNCYTNMFRDCTSLTTAPELPATKLDYYYYCYTNMFRDCTSLKRIKMNASSGNFTSNMFNGCTSLELVDMTGSTGVPKLSNVNNFANTNDTYKIVVPDSLYDTWVNETNWVSIASHIMKQSDWNAAHPDDILG